MNSLVKAIDEAVAFVRLHSEQMTREELGKFSALANQVYLEAYRRDLVDALPRVPELRPQLESSDPPLPPVQFETKLNLPGDWDTVPPHDNSVVVDIVGCMKDDNIFLPPVCDSLKVPKAERRPAFLVCAPPRWWLDLEILRVLAEDDTALSEDDDRAWILVSEALPHLPFLSNRRALYKFADEHPDKLRLRAHPNHPRRRQANAADVLHLVMDHDEQTFESLGKPSADDLPSISEQGVAALAERVTRMRNRKRPRE